jgi:hypothetical protein
MFFVCFHPFSNKVKMFTYVQAFLKLSLDSRWKLSFYFHYYWIQWTRQKYWNFFFPDIHKLWCCLLEQISGYFIWLTNQRKFQIHCYFTNYFLVWKFGFVFATNLCSCPVGKCSFAGRLSVLLQWRLVVFSDSIRVG